MESRIWRALGDGCPLAGCQVAMKTIEQNIDQFDLSIVERGARPK